MGKWLGDKFDLVIASFAKVLGASAAAAVAGAAVLLVLWILRIPMDFLHSTNAPTIAVAAFVGALIGSQ